MRTAPPDLLPIFRSKMQVEMLGLLLLQPEASWTLNELANRVGAPQSSIHRELRRAVDAGIVVRDSSQRPHRYRAATRSPAYEPLRLLLEPTVGLPERLRQALADVDGIETVTLHGSWAEGRQRPDSDIDVLIVGDGGRRVMLGQVKRVGREIGRDIDATLLDVKEFRELSRRGNPLVRRILSGPRVDVLGDLESLTGS